MARRVLSVLIGLLVGLLAWRLLVGLIPASDSAARAAEAAGLVSFTLLQGYDKGQEVAAWLLGCALLPLGAWLGWYLGERSGRRARPKGLKPSTLPTGPAWILVAGAIAAAAIRPGFVTGQSAWGTFGLLGEEGVYLGAVQALRTGRTLYADLAFPYGPLLIHPLDLWLRLTGDTVTSARFFALLLHLLGLLGAGATARWLLGPGRGDWAAAGTVLALAAFANSPLPTLNGVLLRPVLAFLPAAALVAALRADRAPKRLVREDEEAAALLEKQLRRWFVGAGAAFAAAALFSFEVAVAALAATATAALLLRVPAARARLWLAGAAAVTVLAFLPGGPRELVGFFAQGLELGELSRLGYQALPYPDLLGVFADASGTVGRFAPHDPATAGWAVAAPLAIWGALAAGVCGLPRLRGDRGTTAMLLVGIAGIFLYRAAFGRSDLYHLWFYGAVPVALALNVGIGLVWERLPRVGRAAAAAVWVLVVALLTATAVPERIRFPDAEEQRLAEDLGIRDPLEERRVRGVERLGAVHLRPRLARQVEAVVRSAATLPQGDPVWFYPSEAMYWYLTDRPLPSRYLWAYDAATKDMQAQAVHELEEARPRWVYRASDTFEIDHIPQGQLVPELDRYLAEHYRPIEVMPGATLYERTKLMPDPLFGVPPEALPRGGSSDGSAGGIPRGT